jgi:hypothetical protein
MSDQSAEVDYEVTDEELANRAAEVQALREERDAAVAARAAHEAGQTNVSAMEALNAEAEALQAEIDAENARAEGGEVTAPVDVDALGPAYGGSDTEAPSPASVPEPAKPATPPRQPSAVPAAPGVPAGSPASDANADKPQE